jgi:CheY-like chemotaxis protein
MKVLAVEDDVIARTILRRALQHLGHEVIEAENGEAAWQLWKDAPVSVLVCDWMMPQVDGLELCRRIRARTDIPYTYFILLTARGATGENRREAAEAGIDDFLSKPLDPADLWMRLRVAERIIQWVSRVQRLETLLPICSYCKKIRDDHNYWQQIEGFIQERTGSQFSHSICPDCYQGVVRAQMVAEGIPLPPEFPPPPARAG